MFSRTFISTEPKHMRNMIIRRQIISLQFLTQRGMRMWPEPPNYDHIIMPEVRKLPILDAVPQTPNNTSVMKRTKQIADTLGPETIHNRLIYKQFGIVALTGAQLHPNHINYIRNTINKAMDDSKMFAVWRIDAPWKPVTKKGIGKTLGGGKGNIHAYVTPVKPGRVIVEVGGKCEFEEVLPFLKAVSEVMPFMAMPVSQQLIAEIEEEEKKKREQNKNPLTFDFIQKNNIGGCRAWLSPYATLWKGDFY